MTCRKRPYLVFQSQAHLCRHCTGRDTILVGHCAADAEANRLFKAKEHCAALLAQLNSSVAEPFEARQRLVKLQAQGISQDKIPYSLKDVP